MDNSHSEIPNLLDIFASWNRCFTVREVAEWADEPLDLAQLRQSFCGDSKFILLSQPGWGPECFLPERTMFCWWASFSLRLSNIHQSRLSERQLTTALNSLRPESIWFTPPIDILNYGQRFGFVAPAWTPGFYVFPLSYILAQAPPSLWPDVRSTLADFASLEARNKVIRQSASEVVESVLLQFDPRTYKIIKAREPLPPYNERMTLEELGKDFGCTRERIRQLESRFWRRLRDPRAKVRPSFVAAIAALLAELMKRHGSVVLSSSQDNTRFVCFLATCLGVPYAQTKLSDSVVLGISDVEPIELGLAVPVSAATDSNQVAALLDLGPLSFLAGKDLSQIAESIASNRYSRLNKTDKAYLALKHIGKHAHSSEVSEVYNSLFPDDWTSERNVHAVLSRCAEPGIERHGIVWIGVTSTFALKEHGYERPSMGLFDSVTKIVEEKYEETQKPVHISIIATELGKYRQFVNPASFTFATSMNPRLEQVSKDYFIPKDPEEESPAEASADKWDQAIRAFREAHAGDA